MISTPPLAKNFADFSAIDALFFGVELDWQQFFYGLTTPGVCAARGVADADGRCMPGDNPATPEVEGNEALVMDWDSLSTMGLSGVTVEQEGRFLGLGDAFGVSRDLSK